MNLLRIPSLCLLALAAACTPLYFTQPQPADAPALEAFPEDLLGVYDDRQDGGRVRVAPGQAVLVMRDPETGTVEEEVYALSDSVVLKAIGTKYLFSLRAEQGWVVLLLEPRRRGRLLLRGMNALQDRDIHLAKAVMRVDSAELDGSQYYFADPSRAELDAFLRRGGFSQQQADLRRAKER
ncbi:MAG: hypothetical protein NW241_15290 [Bacteroidia bacterium]|nr:hypothetical protein [Bacteroidia bacterium]